MRPCGEALGVLVVAKEKAVGVGLIGFGTIGTGVVKVLRRNADVI